MSVFRLVYFVLVVYKIIKQSLVLPVASLVMLGSVTRPLPCQEPHIILWKSDATSTLRPAYFEAAVHLLAVALESWTPAIFCASGDRSSDNPRNLVAYADPTLQCVGLRLWIPSGGIVRTPKEVCSAPACLMWVGELVEVLNTVNMRKVIIDAWTPICMYIVQCTMYVYIGQI